MYKKLLAVVLAVCMVFETVPMTAYAASSEMENVSVSDAPAGDVSDGDISGNDIGETPIGTEDQTESETEEEGNSEENQGEDADTADVDDEASPEDGSSEIAESEDITEITRDNFNTGYNVEVTDMKEGEATVLNYGTSNTVTLQGYDSENYKVYSQYYTFTAPEDGTYLFHADTLQNSTSSTYVYLYSTYNNGYVSGEIGHAYLSSYSAMDLRTNAMRAGDTVYIQAYTYDTEGVTFELEIRKVPVYSLVKQDNGSYTAETEDYIFSANVETGCQNMRGNVALKAKEGQSLESDFGVDIVSQKKGSSSDNTIHVNLTSAKQYEGSFSRTVERGSEYSIYFVLRDRTTDDVLSYFEFDSMFTTGTTDESVVIYDVTATESSVTFNMELFQSGYCYYAPADNPEDENSCSVSSGWKDVVISYLNPETEYIFEFVNTAGKSLYTTSVTTKESQVTTTYAASVSEDGSKLTVKADVSNYTGSDTYAYLCCEYRDALGILQSKKQYHYLGSIEDTGNGKSFSMTYDWANPALVAGTEYDITIWIQIGNVTHKKVVKTVEIPDSTVQEADVRFAVNANEESTGKADYEIQINNLDGTVDALLCYRQHGDEGDYTRKVISVSGSSPISDSLSNLQQGVTYDFVLFAYGIRKEASVTLGTASTQLTKVGEDEINAFDFVRTYKVEATGDLQSEYYLNMYYLNGGSYNLCGSGMELNSDNDYQATINSADYGKLDPGTEYRIKWTLTTGSGTTLFVTYDTILTANTATAFDYEVTESSYNKQEYTLTLKQDSIANFDSFGNLNLYGYIRKEGDNSYRKSGTVNFGSYYGWSNVLSFEGLDEKTSYEVSVRDRNGLEYFAFNFTTLEDTREISITSITENLHNAYISYSLSGTGEESGTVICYIREAGTEAAWEKADYVNYSASKVEGNLSIHSYDGASLKDGTTYEYQIGLGNSGSTYLSDLEKVISGQFATIKDNRTLSKVEVSSGYTTASITADISENDNNIGSFIYFFYREENTNNWTSAGSYYTYLDSDSFTKKITGLQIGTTYDYAVVISDNYYCSGPDEITTEQKKVVGKFTTKNSTYTLDFEVDENKTTYKSATVAVTAKGSTDDNMVKVVLTLNDGQEQTVTLKKSSGYTKDVTFTDLFVETEYTITKAVLYVTDNGSNLKIAEIDCDYKFSTKEAVLPDSITLSESEIMLNLGTSVEEFKSKTLNAAIQPKAAITDLVWISSDEAVATVSETGTVYARGVGTAEITAMSRYDETVKATCSVTVKKYVIGCEDESGIVTSLSYAKTFYVYKNSTLDGFGFYEQNEDGSITPLTDYTVTPVRDGIVSWKQGSLEATGVGYTRIDFEKDGVKAAICLDVSVAGKGFGITGFAYSDSSYPAIENKDGSYTLALADGVCYYAMGEISPWQDFFPDEFEWSVSDDTVATVDEEGIVTPLKAGTVTLTVVPIDNGTDISYIQDQVTVELNIKDIPTEGTDTALYASANVYSKIGDVALPESWGEGWSWKYPDAPLVTNNINSDNYHDFHLVYTGTDMYPAETTIRVYIGKITGVYVFENVNGTAHNQVLEVGGNDSIRFTIGVNYQGKLAKEDYSIELPDVEGLTLTMESTGIYTVTAQKAGKYTLRPQVRTIANNKVIATSAYKINVVEGKQAAGISFTTDTDGVTIEGNKVIFDTVDAKKDFNLNATVVDRNGESLETALQWETTDKKVATVDAASKKDTHTAKVSVKGEGHAVIMVTAKDMTGYQAQLDVEVRNKAPRVDTNKATVNIAYDYTIYEGRNLAATAGLVEIVPVYGEYISSVQLLDKKSKTEISDLRMSQYDENKYLVIPAGEEIKTGSQDCILRVVTDDGSEYDYNLKVSVVNKKPSVSAKMSSPVNLFYTSDTGIINLKISNNARVESVTWQDEAQGTENGFSMTGHYYLSSGNKYYSYIRVSQQEKLEVVKGSLQDASVAKGTITVRLYGYREEYCFKDFSVKYNYKKPTLVTLGSSTTVAPSSGMDYNGFILYDKTNKSYIYYSENNSGQNIFYYNEVMCDDEDVELTYVGGAWIEYTYTGKSSSKKITLTLDSEGWREPVKVTHTIKTVKPKVYLSDSELVYNTSKKDTLYTYIEMNGYDVLCTDIVIKGADSKAQKLLDEDLFVITGCSGMSNEIQVTMSNSELMNTTIKAGTYSYKVTPYYTDFETGKKTAMNTLTLKIKVINKPVSAKITPKGSIDLANGSNYSLSSKKNVVVVDPKFYNMADGYYVDEYRLVGEYSEYFKLSEGYSVPYYIRITNNAVGKLKSGQSYKLAVEFTVVTSEGESFTVTSNAFTIKPKQSQPKISVTNNSQTLYAAADNVYRYYYLSVPAFYTISSASGSIDCNKDGVADIVVSGAGTLTVKIADRDAVCASANGKTYSIPVTVKLNGRDGISKDAKVTIKVKVKR